MRGNAMWFIFALSTMLAWGAADLFYKRGADERDRYSHLKTSAAVGIVMGIHAICMLIFTDVEYSFVNILLYAPVSAMYILSMTIGYLGLRYIELSISSPVQNSSGAVSCIMLLIFLGEAMDAFSAVAVALICIGVFALGVFEKQRDSIAEAGENKYRRGFIAIIFPILYCIIDSLGTFLDGYYLDDFAATPLKVMTESDLEMVANISYELTFFICAVIIMIYIHAIKKQPFSRVRQKDRVTAALLETVGQFTYTYAMSSNAVVAAPMIASYAIVAVLLSRVFLKEKLLKRQYAAVFTVLIGIVILGILEGINE